MLSWRPPLAQLAGAWSTDSDQCPHAQRPAQDRRRAAQSERQDRHPLIDFSLWLKTKRRSPPRKPSPKPPLKSRLRRSPPRLRKLPRKPQHRKALLPKLRSRRKELLPPLPRRLPPNCSAKIWPPKRLSKLRVRKILPSASQIFWRRSTTLWSPSRICM